VSLLCAGSTTFRNPGTLGLGSPRMMAWSAKDDAGGLVAADNYRPG